MVLLNMSSITQVTHNAVTLALNPPAQPPVLSTPAGEGLCGKEWMQHLSLVIILPEKDLTLLHCSIKGRRLCVRLKNIWPRGITADSVKLAGQQLQKLPLSVWRLFTNCRQEISAAVLSTASSVAESTTSSIENDWTVGLELGDIADMPVGGSHATAEYVTSRQVSLCLSPTKLCSLQVGPGP